MTVKAGDREERIGARTVLWAAGVQASPLAVSLGAPRDRAGRVEVAPDLSIPGHPEVFVIGDLAKMIIRRRARCRASRRARSRAASTSRRSSRAEARGRPARPAFRYRDKGNMATIGRASAVVATKRVAIHGLFAWLLWWAVHIMFLVGFRNRVFVMFQLGVVVAARSSAARA